MTSKFAIIMLWAHTDSPGRATAGVLLGFLVNPKARDSTDADFARLVRRVNGVIRLADVRHERLRGPFPRVEHLRKTGLSLKYEASAPNRQRPPENRVMYGVLFGEGV